jgi:hypothetical protein
MPLLPRFVTGRSLLSFKFDREQSADANETHSGTGIALLSYMYMLCVYMNTARPMLIRMVGASRCSHVDREHRASSAGEVMRGKSANVLHMTYVVHTERMLLAGSRWLTSGKPPPVAYVRDYSDIFIVRFDRDQRCFSLELPITMQACHAYPPHWELGEDRGLNLRGTVEPRVSA